MILRPHHLLCLLAFRGVAESTALGLRMEKMRQRYLGGEAVSIREGHDTICAQCPHMEPGTTCGSEAGAVTSDELDRRIVDLLGLSAGSTTDIQKVAEILAHVSDETLLKVCKGCSWRDTMNCMPCIRETVDGLTTP